MPAISNLDLLTEALRAAAEPSRLRLLALCGPQRVSVSECAQVIGATEPSVSRHLRQLEDAGLVRRAREGQRIYFRVNDTGSHAGLLAALRAVFEADNVLLEQDQLRLRRLRDGAPQSHALLLDGRLGRALAATATASLSNTPRPQAVFVACARVADLLSPLLELAVPVEVALADAPQRAALAAWCAARHPLADLQFSRAGAVSATRRECDLLVIDGSGLSESGLRAVLAGIPSTLAPGVSLWLCASYEQLDAAAAGAPNPLSRLRSLLDEYGFDCTRLQPIEADGEHLIFSAARLRVRSLQATA